MPGGSKEGGAPSRQFIRKLRPSLRTSRAAAAMGPDGAGHYVKMVHNGIEYGDMQLICEAYVILKTLLNPSADEFAKIFSDWNKGQLNSRLLRSPQTFLSETTMRLVNRSST